MIFWSNRNLVIARVSVHKCVEFVSRNFIQDSVDEGQGKMVLLRPFIESPVIDAYSYLPILFLDQYHG